MKNGVVWDVTPFGSCKNGRFGGTLLVTANVVLVTLMKEAISSSETSGLTRATWRNIPEDVILHLVFLRSMRWLLVTASVLPSSPILVTLMKEAISSSETSVLTRATWRNIPEGIILRTLRCSFIQKECSTPDSLVTD
jgi:hypothetical protein